MTGKGRSLKIKVKTVRRRRRREGGHELKNSKVQALRCEHLLPAVSKSRIKLERWKKTNRVAKKHEAVGGGEIPADLGKYVRGKRSRESRDRRPLSDGRQSYRSKERRDRLVRKV